MIERNHGLDGLRGVAVVLTYLVHYCGSYMAKFRGANPNVANPYFESYFSSLEGFAKAKGHFGHWYSGPWPTAVKQKLQPGQKSLATNLKIFVSLS